MRAFIDLNTRKFIQAPGVSAEVSELDFKRSAFDALEVQFTRDRVVVELPGDATGKWEVKPTDEFDNQPITGADGWIKSGAGENTVYTFVFTWISVPLDLLFEVDADVENDVKLLTFMGAVQWTTGGKTIESETAIVNVKNNVIRDGDELPEMPPLAFGLFFAKGQQAIGTGVDFVAVEFDPPFPAGSTVVVTASVLKAAAADANLTATIRGEDTDENGFTADLSAETPDATHKLNFIAIGTPP